MTGRPPDSAIPEIENPIVRRAFWAISAQVPLEAVVRSLLDSEDVKSLPDNELLRIIEEADRFWRDRYKDCVRTPAVVAAYPVVMEACCHQRYERLWEERKSAPEAERAALTTRMGRLLTVCVRCVLAGAETILLNENFQKAYHMFGGAEQMARQMPDEGSLRLYEILWARYGQWAAASMGNRRDETDSACAGISEILLQVGSEAEECIKKIEQLFARHQWVLRERARLRREQQGQVAGQGPPGPPEEPGAVSAMSTLIERLAFEVESGKLTLEAARERARAEFPSLHVQPGMMRFILGVYTSLADIDPERAVRLGEIASEMAAQFGDHPYVQGAGLFSLGFALNHLARKQGSGFERAIATLERAYQLVSSEQGPDGMGPEHDHLVARICCEAAISSRYLRDAPALLRWAEEAVVLSERVPCPPEERGTAYGLRGEAGERMGALDTALDDHFRALELFREAGSPLNVRRACHHIFKLCIRANRLDEAAAAGDEIIEIARRVGDLDDLLEIVFELARAVGRLGQIESAGLYLDRAERIVQEEAAAKDGADPKLSLHVFRILMWRARFSVALLGAEYALLGEDRHIVLTRTRDDIENARRIALELDRDDLLAQAWLQRAQLAEIHDPVSAQAFCRMLDLISGCPPELLVFSFLIGGRIAARLEDFEEALHWFDQGLKSQVGREYDDLVIPFLSMRGEVKERLGDRIGAIQDYEEAVKRTAGFRDLLGEESRIGTLRLAGDALERLFVLNAGPGPPADARCALHWAEYSKSRALAELMGQSVVLPAPAPEVEPLVMEEYEALSAIRVARAASAATTAQVGLDQLHAMRVKTSRLNEIWDQLEREHPEYVELRRGAVPSWREIVEMTAG
jgi:tetratricopeptide (TPR) repeat protein